MVSSKSGNNESCRTLLRPEKPTPSGRIGPIWRGSMSSRRAIAASAAASVVAYGRVAERVSVFISDFFSLTVTVRAPRPSRPSRWWACSAIGAIASRNSSSVVRSVAKVDSALICLATARSATGRSSIPWASRCNAGPIVAPRMLAASASLSAAMCPIVSIPSRRSFSSATGPIPHSLRTARPSSSRFSSARRMTWMPSWMPSGLAKPDGSQVVRTPDDLDAIGFGQTGRDLGDLLARTGADGGDQAGLVADPSAQLGAELFDLGLGCADQFRRLAERLVEGELLDDGHHGAHGVEDPAAGDAVHRAARRQHDRGNTDQPACLMHRHGRPGPEYPRLIAGAGHHATSAQPADQHRPTLQRGPRDLLDGREERVHVEVQHPA